MKEDGCEAQEHDVGDNRGAILEKDAGDGG